ncbi:hypothetical protein ACFJIW_11815 [Tahibacter sp. UC22_41]|uniref:hypothetical protein n=1 Tax=Tahibacter sp. UC22_41 TaxID=3350178 RepID=UPI0036DC8072
MKARFLLSALAGALISTSALATDFGGTCHTCSGGGGSASWLAAAVGVAQANNAAQGDALLLCKDFAGGSSVVHEYSVDSAPVVSSGDITLVHSEAVEALTCADLGFD